MSFFERTIFFGQFQLIPFATALDGMRRVWLGGTNLAFFIDIAAGYQVPPDPDLDSMQTYIDQEKTLWGLIPPIFRLPLTPFIDYTNACEAILLMFKNIRDTCPLKCATCEECQAMQHQPEPSVL